MILFTQKERDDVGPNSPGFIDTLISVGMDLMYGYWDAEISITFPISCSVI